MYIDRQIDRFKYIHRCRLKIVQIDRNIDRLQILELKELFPSAFGSSRVRMEIDKQIDLVRNIKI